jgi:hypothetical protein
MLMPAFHIVQLERFLRGNQGTITQLIDQCYARTGGHYTVMPPEQRLRQAAADTEEFIADLLRGSVDRDATRQGLATIADSIATLDDITRMSSLLEPAFITFVQDQLVAQPALTEDLIRRTRNVNANLRATVTALRMEVFLRRFATKPL